MILSNIATYNGAATAVNGTDTFTMPSEVTERSHVQFGLTFDDTPGAGTYTITAETLQNPGVYQSILSGTSVSASAALTTLSANANITAVKVVTASITTAATYVLRVTASLN